MQGKQRASLPMPILVLKVTFPSRLNSPLLRNWDAHLNGRYSKKQADLNFTLRGFKKKKREECGAVMAFLEIVDVDELRIYGVGILNRTMKMGVV